MVFIVEMLFMLFFVISLRNGLKMSEYEAYWLTNFPLLIIGCVPRNNYGDLKKANKQV